MIKGIFCLFFQVPNFPPSLNLWKFYEWNRICSAIGDWSFFSPFFEEKACWFNFKFLFPSSFVPYTHIESEAILSLDDDFLMLTPDEIELGFQVSSTTLIRVWTFQRTTMKTKQNETKWTDGITKWNKMNGRNNKVMWKETSVDVKFNTEKTGNFKIYIFSCRCGWRTRTV